MKEIIGYIYLMFWGAFISNLDRIQPWLEKKIKKLGNKLTEED